VSLAFLSYSLAAICKDGNPSTTIVHSVYSVPDRLTRDCPRPIGQPCYYSPRRKALIAFASSLERAVPLPAPGQFGRGMGKGSTGEGGNVVWVGYVDEPCWEEYEGEREKGVALVR